MDWLQGIGITALAAVFLILLGCLIRVFLRLYIKSNFDIKHTLQFKELPSFPQKTSTKKKPRLRLGIVRLWIGSHNDILIDRTTFKRICRYKGHCLLFDFLLNVGALSNKRQCPLANPDTLHDDAYGLIKPSDEENEAHGRAMFGTGEFTYKPIQKTIQKGEWINVDVPFLLLPDKSHLIETTLNYRVDLKDRHKAIQLIDNILTSVFRLKNNVHFDKKFRIYAVFDSNGKKRTHDVRSRVKEHQLGDTSVVSSSYEGFGKLDASMKLISSLQRCIIDFINKHSDTEISEISTEQLRDKLVKCFPTVKVHLTHPPNAKFRFVSKDTMQDLLPCLRLCTEFCKKFLDCTNYASLTSHMSRYFILAPYLLEDSYSYLILSGHSPFLDLILSVKLRKGRFLPALTKSIIAEFKVVPMNWKMKRELKRRNNKLTKYVREVQESA